MHDLVIDIIAGVTRYPTSVLTEEASLEDDLGIDSVKQAEIFAVLSQRLGLSREVKRGSVRTIRDVVALCSAQASLQPGPAAVEAAAAAAPAPEPVTVAAPPVPAADVLAELTAIVAGVTRYPTALLLPDAHLEDELGVDSVKQAEILATVVARWPAAQGLDVRRDKLETLGAIARALTARVVPVPAAVRGPSASNQAPATPAPAPERRETPDPTVLRVLPHGPLHGKVALVTGSGRGIGRLIATRLAELGASVVVNAFHSRAAGEATAEAIRAAGGDALFAWGSVANESHVRTIFEQIDQAYGRLDFLVCNASDGLIAPFDQVGTADWDRAFRTCVTGTHLCAMAASERMRGRGGAIVTLSTVTAHRYLRGFGSQGVVKAAVESLTRYLACELAVHGIRTNCVSAGPVYGELLEKFPQAEQTIAHWERITPGGELCRPEDVVSVVEMLLDERSARVNGAVWVVDNGVSAQIDGRFVADAPTGASTQGLAQGQGLALAR